MPQPEIRNGLLDMETRTRRVPPPRHPKLAVTTPPAPDRPAPDRPAAEEPAERSSPESVRPAQLQSPKSSSLRGAMVYLDGAADSFLKACHQAGGVSASAVIRLALRKLADVQTPAGVADELLSGSDAQRAPGRKRL